MPTVPPSPGQRPVRLNAAERAAVCNHLWRESAAMQRRADQMKANPAQYSEVDVSISATAARIFDIAAQELHALGEKQS